MKRFISGVVVGVLLFAGGSVFADTVNLVGQKVQGIFSVEQNGTKVADAVVINGSAYAPVRAIAQATGSKLTVEGKKIIVEKSTAIDEGLAGLKSQRESLIKDIAALEKQIKGYKENILPTYKLQAEELANNGDLGKRAAETLAEFEEQVKKWEAELTTLQTQLTAIDAQLAATK